MLPIQAQKDGAMDACARAALRCATLLMALATMLMPAFADLCRVQPGHNRCLALPEQPQTPTKTDRTSPPAGPLFDSRRLEGGGTMLLDDIMSLVRLSPRLLDEVQSALRDLNKTAQDITCIGKRIDGRWRHLAGARVQPYTCRFGARWLEISADLRILGRRGESYEAVSDAAMRNASSIKESNPRWGWTTTKPRDWFLE
jgi:hypothetical protein